MARMEDDGGSAARSSRESGSKGAVAGPIRHASGLFQKVHLPRGNVSASEKPAGHEAPAPPRPVPEVRRLVPLRRECDSRTLAALLRLLGVGAAALAMAGACPDGADTSDCCWDVTVDIQPTSAIAAPPVIEMRPGPDQPGLCVDGQPVHAGPDELQLLQLVLAEPGSWQPYDLVDSRIWPAEKGSLDNRRKNLFWRVNQRLKPEIDAALARRGQMRSPDAPRIIQSRGGHVRFNLRACGGVSQKI